MNIKFYVNDYVLVWNLLFQASISEQIYKLKQKLWTNYKEEYNNTYRDKNLILKDAKNFIPNNDTIYNIVLETKEYEKLKKQTEKYRVELMKIWDENKRLLNAFFKSIIRKEIKPYTILVINEELNVIEVVNQESEIGTIIVGKKVDKKEPTRVIVDIAMAILKNETKITKEKNELATAILELAILNELATILTKKSCYISGTPSLVNIKRCLYPYWLMYMAVPKAEFLTYMSRDKIAFDHNNMAYEKELRKINLEGLIDYCYRNKKYILKNEKIDVL